MFHPRVAPVSALASVALAASLSAQSHLPQYGQVLAQLNGTAAGLAPGEVFGTTSPVDSPVLSSTGIVLFRVTLATGGTVTANNNRALVYGHDSGDLAVLVRTDGIDPSGTYPNSHLLQVSSGTGNVLGSNLFSTQRISPQGNFVMFGAQLHDGGNPGLDSLVHTSGAGIINDTLIYYGPPSGPLQILAQRGTTTMPGGARLFSALTGISQQTTSLNSSGLAVFKSDLEGGDVTGTNNDSAWIIGTPGNLSYLLREGDSVLGGANVIPAGGLGSNCALNEAGSVLHDEKLSLTVGTPPATAANDQVVFITIGGTHLLLVREGDTAPDANGVPMVGVTYGAPTLAQGFPNSGRAAFHCTLGGATTATDGALFIGDPSFVQLVAREGDVVPGTGGEVIDVINSTTSFTDNGGLLFGGTLLQPGGGVTAVNDSFLCIARPSQPLQLIVRENDPCPGLPGYRFGNVAGSSNFGSASGHKNNELGQVLFSLAVNDGTNAPTATYSWDPVRGLELQLLGHTTLGDVMGGGTVTLPGTPTQFPSGDGNPVGFNGTGEFVLRPSITAPSGAFIVRGAIGADIQPATTVSLCPSPATLSVTGSPSLGDSFTINVSGATGLPFAGYGFAPQIPLPLPCGCSLISDGTGFGLGDFQFTTSRTLTVPYFPVFLGVQIECQGLDLFATTGGCSVGFSLGLTDIWTVTIG